MKKKKNDEIIKNALKNSKNSYQDKLAILKFITQNKSDTISNVLSSILKKK